jgi:signal transduction histidine kinase
MNFGAVQERYEKEYGLKELNPIMHMVEDTTDELRKTAHNLMPGILLKHSMSEALRIYCSNINATGKLHISLRLYGQPDELPQDFQLMLYRIVQELIQNIIKHAYATQAVVELEHKEGRIHVLIEDDGRGFDTHTPEKGGFGLQNLRFRVQALQGYIAIESAKGTGTTINITFDDEIVKSAFPL